MPKRYVLVAALSFIGMLVALVGLLVYFTQAVGVQIIFLQSLYWNLDRVWGLGRIIIYFLVVFTASVSAIFRYRKLSDRLNSMLLSYLILFSVSGLLFGSFFFILTYVAIRPLYSISAFL